VLAIFYDIEERVILAMRCCTEREIASFESYACVN
jgi:hypothetical protein